MTTRKLLPTSRRRRIRILVIVVVVLALAATAFFVSQSEVTAECGGDTIAPAAPVSVGDPPVTVDAETLVEIQSAVDADYHPTTGDWYIAVKDGRLVRFDGTATETVVDITDEVSGDLEQGLLGVAVAPAGDEVYVYWTDLDDASHIDVYTIGTDGLDEASRRPLLMLEQPTHEHNAGDLEFGPDGRLYMAYGDGGEAERAQDPESWFGTIVALDVSGDVVETGDPEAPLAGAEILAYGLRNPWRFSIDVPTGDIWIGDVGDECFEEIDVIRAGAGVPNFGWPGYEGLHEHPGDAPADSAPPLHEFDHVTRCSVSGGVVYRGSAIPELVGSYIYADFCSSELLALTENADGTWTESNLGVPIATIASIVDGPDGELLAISMTEGIKKIVP